MDDNQSTPGKHTFRVTQRLLDDAVFQVDEYRGSFEQYDNQMSSERRLLVFERGDSVAALLFDPFHREVILVEQFRLPTAAKGMRNGWILEPAAGIVRGNETPRQSIIRELREETGYQVSELVQIATFFVSPGGTSERIFLFYAEVRRTEQVHRGGGSKREGEDIKTVRMPIAEFFDKLRNQQLEDGKLIIAAQWLKERRATLPADDAGPSKPFERKVKLSRAGGRIVRRRPPERFVGYMTGDILNVDCVDVWVNPLNTDMMLDRFTDRTVSAVIRRSGAEKYPGTNRIQRDTIGEELQGAMNGRTFVKPAKVIDTSSGELAKSNNVQRIFHVATAKGEIGDEQSSDLETLDRCVDNVLAAIERRGRYTSVLFPMLGTGDGGYPVNQVAQRLLLRSIDFFRDSPKARLQRIYFLGYSEVDADVLADAMKSLETHFD
jgi:nudix-type nucleoside diphosphatase (YffH/AdpP family)